MKKLILIYLLCSTSILFSQTNSPCSGGSIVAPTVTVGSNCNYTTYSTVGATEQTNAANGGSPSCGSMGEDVWLSFVAPASGEVIITTDGFTDGVMSLYSGSCGTWIELDCSDDWNGSMPEITNTSLTPGETYLIRFWEYGGGEVSFDLCVIDNDPAGIAPANDACIDAVSLTVGVAGSCSSVAGTVDSATDSGISNACFGDANDDVWYSFEAINDSIYIDRDANFDSEIAVYNSCGGAAITCQDGEGTLLLTGLTVGNTYLISIYSYSTSDPFDPTFDICVYEPIPVGPLPGNVSCGGMEPICMSNSLVFLAQDSDLIAEPGNNYGCLSSQPDPTWYYLEISEAGDLEMDLTAGSDIDYAIWGPYSSLTAAQAACGSHPAPVDCSFSTSATEFISVPNVSVGDVYVLVITNYAEIVQNITLEASFGNTANTDCSIVTCGADAGSW